MAGMRSSVTLDASRVGFIINEGRFWDAAKCVERASTEHHQRWPEMPVVLPSYTQVANGLAERGGSKHSVYDWVYRERERLKRWRARARAAAEDESDSDLSGEDSGYAYGGGGGGGIP